MVGVKGKTGRHSNRSNQWLKGKERSRTDEVFAFKPRLEVIEQVKQDMEKRQITKTEWLDLAVNAMLGLPGEDEESSPAVEAVEISPALRDAITTTIGLKRAAIRAESKKKIAQRDQVLIEKWEKEVQELENLL